MTDFSFQDFFRLGMKRDVPTLRPMPTDGIVLNVGAGFSLIPGTTPLDLPTWDADRMPIPYPDGSVLGIHCYHFLEHVADPIAIMREFQRVLRPGGILNIVVPYYSSNMAAQDLDHKHAFTETTFTNLFSSTTYAKNKNGWAFHIRFTMIAGIVERNLALFFQLQRQ